MAAETDELGPTIIGGRQSLHLEVVRLKYVRLKIAESHKLAGEKKITLREQGEQGARRSEVGFEISGVG